jgi:hypothetical protein
VGNRNHSKRSRTLKKNLNFIFKMKKSKFLILFLVILFKCLKAEAASPNILKADFKIEEREIKYLQWFSQIFHFKKQQSLPNNLVIVTKENYEIRTVDGNVVTLKAGTFIPVELAQMASSQILTNGSNIELRVRQNIEVSGKTVIQAMANGKATVTEVKKAKGMGKPGKLSIAAQSVMSVDGQQILISGTPLSVQGENKSSLAWGLWILLFLTTLVLAIIPALFVKGGEAVINQGTSLSSSSLNRVDIEIHN